MKKLFAILLIIIGSFLEVWYYISRFERDGLEFWLAAIMGGFLTLLLSVLIMLKIDKLWRKIGIVALIIYSVLATASGQSFHLAQLEKTEIIDIAKNENLYGLIKETRTLKTQYETERKQITGKINSIGVWSRQNLYSDEIEKLEKRRDFLDTEIIRLQSIIDKDSRSVDISDDIKKKKTENSYEFYERLSGIPAQWSQFFLQILLSIFFAIGSPIGITLIMSGKSKKDKPIKQKKEKIIIDSKKISRWVQINWTGVRMGKSKEILPEKTFFEFVSERGEIFTKKEYYTILNTARRCNIIDNITILQYNEIEASRRISEMLS